jgi:transcriptional regulator with XRE-family HTH domain
VSIGDNVRATRKTAGISQEEVARRAGVSLNVINRLERGVILDPHYSTLRGIASALGVQVEDLVREPALATTPGKDEAPPDTGHASHAVLVKKALVAARLDAQKTDKAINRLHASEGTLPATHITGFESDKVGLELREAGFGDDQIEEFVWPLVTKVIEQEREISRLRENVADASEAQETVEGAAEQPKDLEGLGDLLGEWARSLYENEEVRRRLTVGHEAFARGGPQRGPPRASKGRAQGRRAQRSTGCRLGPLQRG